MLDDRAVILSFSGGRSSGMMLHRWLDEHDGLPADHHVVFCNTGKERVETLDFVRDCGAHWNVHINWLEYRWEPGRHFFEVVSHNSASRDGEPFAMAIKARSYLPNIVSRFCTSELKVKTTSRWARANGIDRWTSAIGLRADEAPRVDGMNRRNALNKERWSTIAPLFDAGIAKRDVMAFWQAQPFDLGLQQVNGSTPEGNCDNCFMKRLSTVAGNIERNPDSADWWIEQERWVSENTGFSGAGNRFRKDWPSYAAIKAAAAAQGSLALGDEMSPSQLARRSQVCGFDMDAVDPCACSE